MPIEYVKQEVPGYLHLGIGGCGRASTCVGEREGDEIDGEAHQACDNEPFGAGAWEVAMIVVTRRRGHFRSTTVTRHAHLSVML